VSIFIKDWGQVEVEAVTRSVRRYSYLVTSLKFIIPFLALTLVLLMFVFTSDDTESEKITLEPGEVAVSGVEQSSMINPRFHGVDADNQPYNIFAKTATQQSEKEVFLENLTADITLQDGSWISMVADSGVYKFNEELLRLSGVVEVFITAYDFSGYEIRTKDAIADIKRGYLMSDADVTAKSDMGDFTAKGFLIEQGNQKITFKGPIKLVIFQ